MGSALRPTPDSWLFCRQLELSGDVMDVGPFTLEPACLEAVGNQAVRIWQVWPFLPVAPQTSPLPVLLTEQTALRMSF